MKKIHGKVEFKAPLVLTAPTYNIIEELKEEGDWEILQKYSGFEFDDSSPKNIARTKYENILYLERPGCNLISILSLILGLVIIILTQNTYQSSVTFFSSFSRYGKSKY